MSNKLIDLPLINIRIYNKTVLELRKKAISLLAPKAKFHIQAFINDQTLYFHCGLENGEPNSEYANKLYEILKLVHLPVQSKNTLC